MNNDLKIKTERWNSETQFNIGNKYCHGDGVEKNLKEAAPTIRESKDE